MSENPLEYASWLRRVVALLIDWVACSLVSLGIAGPHNYSHDRSTNWLTLGIFLLESGLGTALTGGSFGQLLTRIRVLQTNGAPVTLLMGLLRSVLVCLVVPPLVFKPETGRGLHDMATRSAAYKLPTRA